MSATEFTCLLSHKCTREAHELGGRLKAALQSWSIDLLIDPFRLGDDVETRIDSFDFDPLLFLCSPESLASQMCRRELQTARRRSVPVLATLLAGSIPKSLRNRIYWSPPEVNSPEYMNGIAELGQAIRERSALWRDVRMLRIDPPPDETRNAAQRIALEYDCALVAEGVSPLARCYTQLKDPTTRYWIALALGSAGTPRAARLLNGLPQEGHPYALEGIRQAREMIGWESRRNA